jgi:hypothetical protein
MMHKQGKKFVYVFDMKGAIGEKLGFYKDVEKPNNAVWGKRMRFVDIDKQQIAFLYAVSFAVDTVLARSFRDINQLDEVVHMQRLRASVPTGIYRYILAVADPVVVSILFHAILDIVILRRIFIGLVSKPNARF